MPVPWLKPSPALSAWVRSYRQCCQHRTAKRAKAASFFRCPQRRRCKRQGPVGRGRTSAVSGPIRSERRLLRLDQDRQCAQQEFATPRLRLPNRIPTHRLTVVRSSGATAARGRTRFWVILRGQAIAPTPRATMAVALRPLACQNHARGPCSTSATERPPLRPLQQAARLPMHACRRARSPSAPT